MNPSAYELQTAEPTAEPDSRSSSTKKRVVRTVWLFLSAVVAIAVVASLAVRTVNDVNVADRQVLAARSGQVSKASSSLVVHALSKKEEHVVTAADVLARGDIGWEDLHGLVWSREYGGHGGSQFYLQYGSNRVKRVCIWSGTVVNKIFADYGDGHTRSAGSQHGTEHCFNTQYFKNVDGVNRWFCVTSVRVRAGAVVDKISMKATVIGLLGDDVGGAGGAGGAENLITIRPSMCLCGFGGRAGWHVDRIQFLFC